MGAKKMTDSHSVAVVGLSCRFPGDGNNLEAFWESICTGKSSWSKIPKERFNIDAFWSPSKARNTITTQGAHFLKDDISKFDANFFNLPKVDVEAIDPQQRIMIEVAYEALERAGLPLEKIAGTKTGVFMGHFTSDYKEMIYRNADSAPMYSATGSCTTSLSGRISWLWDLRGPCFTLDTACSSSLVALHQACQSLRDGESDIAIVGGTNLLLNPEMFMFLSNQDFLSPDGKSKAFDESANGYGRGEGFGCVVLKRVDDALQAVDPIRAVIRGTGSNHDGHTKGLTLPSADAQAALINEVYRNAGLDFKDTGYVEAHGTGTQAGDLAEMQALAKTIGAVHTSANKLIVGSVKTNIGHLEAAAGIAGVIKSILILETGWIPPNIHFNSPNTKIKFDEWKLHVPTQLTAWPRNGLRRISTNSFGYAGTNAHVILDDTNSYLKERGLFEAYSGGQAQSDFATKFDELNSVLPGANTSGSTRKPRLYVLSAQDKDGLMRVKAPLAQYIAEKAAELDTKHEQQKELMSKLAFTLSDRRSHLQWRTYALASSADELAQVLRSEESTAVVTQSSRQPRIGFVFTGQGAQWPRMGIELMAYPVFEEAVLASDLYLREVCLCPWSTVEEMEKGKSISQLHLAEFSQTLCAVLQIALIDLLRSWDICPTAVAGHSSGEIAAAYAMGALSREDAWRVAYYRGLLSAGMKAVAPDIDGSMMAVGLSPERTEEWISKVTSGYLVVACINSPTSVTVSGDTSGIDQLFHMLKQDGIFARKLQVDTAYHSPHMHTIAQEYYEWLADLVPLKPEGDCTMHSSVTGSIIEADQLGVVNWVRNLTSPVRFSEAIHNMLRPVRDGKRTDGNAVDVLVEIGPHSALQGPVMQTLAAQNIMNVPYQSIVVRNQNAVETALNLAGALWTQGYNVDIQEVNAHDSKHDIRPFVDLPSYPWKHSQRYYHDVRIEREYLSRQKPQLSLIGAPVPSLGQRERLWRRFIRLSEEPWIADHKIQGTILYPAAGYLAMALEAACQTADETKRVASYKLRDIQLTSAAIISEEQDLECIIQLRPHIAGTRDSSSTWTEFTVTSSPDGKALVTNCSGLLLVEYENAPDSEANRERTLELQALRSQYLEVKASCNNQTGCSEMYNALTSIGLQYGPAFANVREVHNNDGQSCGIVEIPDIPSRVLDNCDRPHIVHPGTLDAVFHLAFASAMGNNALTAMVPKFIAEVMILADIPWMPGTKLPGFSTSEKHGLRDLMADIVMFHDNEGSAAINIQGLLLTEVFGGSAGGNTQDCIGSIASKFIWRPAIDLLSSEELHRALESHSASDILVKYLKLLHHSNPGLSVLEITSGAPQIICGDLCGMLDTAHVTIACVNAKLDSKLVESAPNVTVESLDFSLELSADTLKDRIYDVVVVSDLNAYGQQVELTLSNITKILNPGGRLCLLADDNILAWFQSNSSPELGDTTIFRGAELNVITARKTLSINGIANHDIPAKTEPIKLVVPADLTVTVKSVAEEISTILKGQGYETDLFAWNTDVSVLAGRNCISLLELQEPVLENVTEASFGAIKNLILDSASLFWVTGFDDPSSRIIDGLARVVRNETPGLKFCIFHANRTSMSSPRLADLIYTAFKSSSEDDEYMVKDNILHIGRVEEDHAVNGQISNLLPDAAQTITRMPLRNTPYALRMTIQTPGMLDTLCMEADDVAGTELDPNDVEIQVKVSSINFRDLMTAMGQIPDSKIGVDAAGVVCRIGATVTKFKVGDRVAFFGHGAHSTTPRTRADNCALIPKGMTFEQAASVPTVHGTAWYALVKLARVQPGQSLLVHAAAGGVGQAAIQIAKHFEMEIFATVSSDAKRKLIRDSYGIPDDHIFNSRDISFAKGIKRMTKGRGVDVILNSLSGEALRQTWYCIAPFGYFIEIGLRDILNNTELDMAPFKQDATFTFLNLAHIQKSRPDLMAAIVEGTFDFIRQGRSKPVNPITSYPISDVERAFRLMQAGKHSGKLVLTWGEDDVIPVLDRQKRTLRLDSEGVYLLVGGLGGLGRSLAERLIELGARKLCFLSRSGATSAAAKNLIHSLEHQGVQIQALVCDVSSDSAVAASVARCSQELGTIRGVFQCAMVLRDSLFVNMTHQQWIEATRPKIQGSWNLHKHLPKVDFFIILSSAVATFGNRGQSNYSAGGAYEDALAYYRRSRGLHATTVDLGIMREIGVLAETGITANLRDWEKPYGIRQAEFHALMELAIDGDIKGTNSAQIITGLATGGSAIVAGIDTPYYLDNARFGIMALSGMRNASGLSNAVSDSASAPTHTRIAQAESLEVATTAVTNALIRQIARMLQMPVDEIDTGRFLHNYGIDSLLAIEVVNWALKEAKSIVNVFDVLASIPIASLAGKIAAKSAVLHKGLAQGQ